EGKNEPVLMIQIEKFDISNIQNTKEVWLEFLKILKENEEIIPGNPLIEMIIVHNNSAPTSGGMFGCSRVGNGCEQTTIPNLPKYDNKKKVHDGIDLYAPLNTDVFAMYDGEIVFIENRVPQNEQCTFGALGNRIIIKHTSTQHKKNNNTIYVMFGHLNKVDKNIQPGTKVKQGQKIGISGKTGNAFDIEAWRYHVHLMIYENGTNSENKIDPRKYLTTKFDQNGNKIE
ncbi:MAG: M23 family metallopeptidase, partial [Parcubacteria group bacterium]|nr:M23 family metallopeptidase [Parcubacteria group bacterium]